jgi:hypothetical protein
LQPRSALSWTAGSAISTCAQCDGTAASADPVLALGAHLAQRHLDGHVETLPHPLEAARVAGVNQSSLGQPKGARQSTPKQKPNKTNTHDQNTLSTLVSQWKVFPQRSHCQCRSSQQSYPGGRMKPVHTLQSITPIQQIKQLQHEHDSVRL